MIESELVFKGRIINVYNDRVSLENGRETSREIVRHSGSVGMIAIDCNFIYLVRQYRYAVGDYLLEIPAGTLEKNESPEQCAIRELSEEIKMRPGSIKKIGTLYPSPGFIDEIMHLFLCFDLKPAHGNTDFDENIEIVKMDIDSLKEMILSRELRDGKTVTAVLLYLFQH